VAGQKPKPKNGWLLICGTYEDSEAGWKLRKTVEKAKGGPVRIEATDGWKNLTPGLEIIAAGLYPTQEDATHEKERLQKAGVKCYAKKTGPREIGTGDLIFVGDNFNMWFCFQRGGSRLAYGTCVAQFRRGRKLLRPHAWGEKGGVGFQEVAVLGGKPAGDQGPCADMVEYTGRASAAVKAAPAAEKNTKALLAKTRRHVEAESKLTFPNLRLVRTVRADVTGDGKADTIVDLRAGYRDGSAAIDGNVLAFVGVIPAGEKTMITVFRHSVPAKVAKDDFFAASIFGRLTGVADVNGDGRLDLLLHTGYYEGNGLAAYTVDKGKARQLAENSCGA